MNQVRIALIAGVLVAFPARPAPQDAGTRPGHLVTLNVVALDAHGKPVTGLEASDFRIVDQRKQQKISVFRRSEDAVLKQDEPLGPHQFSNRRGVALPHVTVILFDVLNTPMAEQGYTKNQLVRTLQRMESANSLYFYLLTVNGLYPVRGLPDGETETTPADWTRDAQKIVDNALSRVMLMNPGMYPEDRVRSTFFSLEALANRLAAVTGRKNIVWITRGVPISIGPNRSITGDFQDYEPLVRQMSSTLQEANVAIYTVDDAMASMARVSSVQLPDAAAGRGRGDSAGLAGSDAPNITSRQGGLGSMETLEQFAKLTGGRANFSNDPGAAVKQAMEEARFSYLIGYDPGEENWDNKFHKLQVTCSRRGVKVQAREGYYAIPPSSLLAGQEQAAIDAASLSPFDATEIAMRVTVSPSASAARGTHFQIHTDLNDIVLHPSGESYSGQLSLSLVQYLADGRMSVSPPSGFQFRLSADKYEEARKRGVDLSKDWQMTDGVIKARLILFDYGSKNTGSIAIPISESDRKP